MVLHLPFASEQFVNFDRLFFTDDADRVQLTHFDIVLRQLVGEFAEHGLRIVLLVGALEPRRHVHRVSDHGVIEPILGAHVAHRYLSGIDTDTHE